MIVLMLICFKAMTEQNILKEVEKYNPQRSFPTIIIGDNIIIGFRENDIREALGI